MQPPQSMIPRVVTVFLVAVVVYALGFGLDQWLRMRRGPWQVEFTRTPTGDVMLRVQQPRLGIADIRIVFEGEPATQEVTVVRFDRPHQVLPCGRVKYDDLTYLPGVVTLELSGHELELLPRVLYLNRKPIPWRSATNLVLRAADRPVALPEPKPRKRSMFSGRSESS